MHQTHQRAGVEMETTRGVEVEARRSRSMEKVGAKITVPASMSKQAFVQRAGILYDSMSDAYGGLTGVGVRCQDH